ncbi:MAG: methyltransferase domain-containing protein [Rhodospirillaceae bacterium]|nr:methyltransferase domain-containing protein [Rhodospirillaceae bacterium]MCY4311107.1 methyltransferase domain-containing protein [Rhodospirillaceae bacterium]
MRDMPSVIDAVPKPGEQTWNPDRYARQAGFVAELGMPVVDLLAPQPGEKILDIGCGNGALTVKLRDKGVDVIGIDASAPQIAAARALGLVACVMDGQKLDFPDGSFDAVFSNAALHWMRDDPDAVIKGVWQALKPGGRFVAEMGGGDNVSKIRRAIEAAFRRREIDPAPYNPWYFPEPDEYRRRLESAGFNVRYIRLIDRPTRLPEDLSGWLDTFAESWLAVLDPAEAAAVKVEIANDLEPELKNTENFWMADYVRLRFAADKSSKRGAMFRCPTV